MKFLKLIGEEAREYTNELASLRIKVFREFPYLYDGNLEYEEEYLETYFKSKTGFVFLVIDQDKIVGATTAILANEEEDSFKKPLKEYDWDLDKVLYFGESILLPEYRGKGLGKKFFKEREAYAKELGNIGILTFCAVIRQEDHPLRPKSYQTLEPLWRSQGFGIAANLTTTYKWKDLNEEVDSVKTMQFWCKRFNQK